jgi:hypothetical protein
MGTGRDSPVTGWYSQGIPRLKRGVDDLKTSMQKMIIRALVASRSHSIHVAFLWRSLAKTWRIMLNKPHHYWRFHWAWVIMPCFGGGSNPLAPTSQINGLHLNWCKPFYFDLTRVIQRVIQKNYYKNFSTWFTTSTTHHRTLKVLLKFSEFVLWLLCNVSPLWYQWNLCNQCKLQALCKHCFAALIQFHFYHFISGISISLLAEAFERHVRRRW